MGVISEKQTKWRNPILKDKSFTIAGTLTIIAAISKIICITVNYESLGYSEMYDALILSLIYVPLDQGALCVFLRIHLRGQALPF